VLFVVVDLVVLYSGSQTLMGNLHFLATCIVFVFFVRIMFHISFFANQINLLLLLLLLLPPAPAPPPSPPPHPPFLLLLKGTLWCM